MVLSDDIRKVICNNILTEHYNKYINTHSSHSFIGTAGGRPLSLVTLELNNFYSNMVSNLIHITKCNVIQASASLEWNIDDSFNEYYYKYKDEIINTVIKSAYVKEFKIYKLRNVYFSNPIKLLINIEQGLYAEQKSQVKTFISNCLYNVARAGVSHE